MNVRDFTDKGLLNGLEQIKAEIKNRKIKHIPDNLIKELRAEFKKLPKKEKTLKIDLPITINVEFQPCYLDTTGKVKIIVNDITNFNNDKLYRASDQTLIELVPQLAADKKELEEFIKPINDKIKIAQKQYKMSRQQILNLIYKK